MRAQTVDVKSSNGRILCCTVFRSGGKKLLAKGHVISDEDIRILESEGMENVWVTELEEGEVHLKPGDVVIQLGTNHNWNNRGTVPCVMAYVLIATEGAKTTGWGEHKDKPHGR